MSIFVQSDKITFLGYFTIDFNLKRLYTLTIANNQGC